MKNFLEKAKKIAIVAPFAFIAPVLALAQSTAPIQAPSGVLSGGLTGVSNELCVIFNWMFYFLIILAIIFVVVAAFRYLFAAGDPEKVKAAGHALIYAAVAIAVALIAKAVPGVVGTLLGAGTISAC
jgi:hypothetical protein